MNESRDRAAESPDLFADDDLAAELRAAGRRQPVPADDLQAINAAARGEWQALVGRRRAARRSRWLLAAASLLALAGSGWWWRAHRLSAPTARSTPRVVARLDRWAGDARVSDQAASRRELPAGAVLTTADAGSFLSLRLINGVSLRLDAASRVRLVSPGAVELQRGAAYIDSPTAATGGIEVRSALGDVRDVGTQFEVRVEGGALRVRVREGQVELRRGEQRLAAHAGEELAWREDGSERRAAVAPQGESWRWAVQAAVAPEIEGMTLAVFLDWISRETGWQVRFADPEVARSAATTVLHGTIEGLAPDQAVSVVLPGSGLAYRVEGATLLVERTR